MARGLAAPALAAVLALCPSPSRAANPSLADDLGTMMDWLSRQTVQGISFNAGTTFDPPLELSAGTMQLELTLGVGAVPLDITAFPKMHNTMLNDMQVGAYFPASVPFPDITAHYRIGLGGRFDAALRLTNVTVPNYKMTEEMTVKGQTNNFGFQLRRFFGDGDYCPLFSVGVHANYLRGKFTFTNKYRNVVLANVLDPVNIDNSGALKWHLQSHGVKAVMSHRYGKWLPFLGGGYSLGTGLLEASLRSEFDAYTEEPIVGQRDSKPKQATARMLWGVQYCRDSGWDLFLTGELLIAGVGERRTYNIHAGLVMPFRFGSARRDVVVKKVSLDNSKAKLEKLSKEHLIFIR